MDENKRFNVLLNYLLTKKIVRNQQQFAEEINSDKTTVSQIKNGNINIPNNMFANIESAYPYISSDWLRTGEGEMLKNNQQSNENVSNNTGIVGNNVSGGGINDAGIINGLLKRIEKRDEQVDRLLTIIEKLSNQV